MWKKRKTDDFSIDFETMEDIIAELVELMGEETIDLSKPFRVGFQLSLDENGSLGITEYGILKHKVAQKVTNELPLVELITFDKDLVVVLETGDTPRNQFDIDILEDSLIVSNKKARDVSRKIIFPYNVDKKTLKSTYNNGVLEMRLSKKIASGPEQKILK